MGGVWGRARARSAGACGGGARYSSRPPLRATSRHITDSLRPVCTAISLFVSRIARHRDISSRSSSVSGRRCSPNGPSVLDRSAENLSKENQPQEDCNTSGKIPLSRKARLPSPLRIKQTSDVAAVNRDGEQRIAHIGIPFH